MAERGITWVLLFGAKGIALWCNLTEENPGEAAAGLNPGRDGIECDDEHAKFFAIRETKEATAEEKLPACKDQ